MPHTGRCVGMPHSNFSRFSGGQIAASAAPIFTPNMRLRAQIYSTVNYTCQRKRKHQTKNRELPILALPRLSPLLKPVCLTNTWSRRR